MRTGTRDAKKDDDDRLHGLGNEFTTVAHTGTRDAKKDDDDTFPLRSLSSTYFKQS